MKFIERFNEQNKKSLSVRPSTRTHKTHAPPKLNRRNIDDTDTESDDDDDRQGADPTSSWIDEWKLYINTYEVVPDDMGIVQWWGVSLQLRSLFPTHPLSD
jgi:hypothetical protein